MSDNGTLHPNPYTINLIDGEAFAYDDAIHGPVTLHAVAHSLARQNRFTGHAIVPNYSVAEHAIGVSRVVEKVYGEHELALAALHHDDAEFVTGDINKPLKTYIQDHGFDFRKLERAIMVPIAVEFGIPIDQFSAGAIHDADDLLYCAEIGLLKPKGHGPIPDEIDPEKIEEAAKYIVGLPPEQAEQAFIMRHKQLTGGLRILTQVIEIDPEGNQEVRDPREGEVEELERERREDQFRDLPPGFDLGN